VQQKLVVMLTLRVGVIVFQSQQIIIIMMETMMVIIQVLLLVINRLVLHIKQVL
jgi:hypothetical protein